MGSAANNNNPGGYDMQNFFKPGNPVNLAPPAPIQHSFHHPFSNPSNFPYQTPAPSSSPFLFPPSMYQNNNNPSYMNYSQAHSQFRLSNPIPSPSSDGARLMAMINNNHASPSSMEMSSPSLTSSSSSSSMSSSEPSFSPAFAPTAPPVNLAPPQRTPSRLLSTKLPRGRHLHGDHVVYDIDLRLPGEAQPQLEVSPITVYGSDPVLVAGRQIAVNRNYICYGLRAGTIRVLNINTALRALLRGHSQRVIDMAFFANDVHLLVSSSSDGRIFIRKIEEGLADDDKPQITEKIVLGIQIFGNWEVVYPRVCWHPHQQDVLFVGVSNYVLKIDIAKARSAAPGGVFSAEDPLQFHIESLIEGIYCIGKHEDDVTDLSICHWSVTCLASASKDGMVKIWGEKKMVPLAALKPHDGRPVGAVGFLDMPNSLDNIVLFTAGPLNQELKLWVSANPDGRFSPSSGKWQCIQTLELKSSLESKNEDAFFNQVLVVARASVILLANAKKNAIYAVHVECNSKPAATRMDYLAEFSVAMPILSFTATTENVTDGEGTVQIYCVQTQAIQQYALEMSQCFPPPVEFTSSEEDTVSRAFERSTSSAFAPLESSHGNNIGEMTVSSGMKSPRPINVRELSKCKSPVYPSTPHAHGNLTVSCADTAFDLSTPINVPTDNAPLSSQVPVPLSPRLSRRLSGTKSPVQIFKHDVYPVSAVGDPSDKQTIQEHSIERKSDAVMMTFSDVGSLEAINTICKGDDRFSAEEEREAQGSQCSSSTIGDECQTSSSQSYLITPSQLMPMALPSDSDKGPNIHNGIEETGPNIENETLKGGNKNAGKSSSNFVEEARSEKGPGSVPNHIGPRASETRNKISKEISSLPTTEVTVEDAQPEGDSEVFEDREHSPNASIEGSQENIKDISCKTPVTALTSAVSPSPSGTKRRKNKNKNMSGLLPSSPSGTPFTSVGSSDGEPGTSMIIPSPENLAAQVVAMQETLSQLVTMQKDLPKHMAIAVSSPVTKEGKRVEAALGQRMEKFLKAQMDALWVRIQEENAKRERSERQLTAMLTNILNKELPATLERLLKKEISSLGTSIARLVTPNVEKAISTSINDTFQKGVSDKALSLLEKSLGTKLESAVCRQIQSQFQSSGKQVLQDALRACFEGSVIPAFEHSCKAMFEQVDTAFQKGMSEHTTAAQHQFSASHTALASTLQDTVASASSLAQSLKAELADGQRKLLALAESAGASSSRVGASSTTKSNGSLGGLPEKAISLEHLEESLDPTKELSRLVSECKFEEAFNKALNMNDVSIVSWLCSQVDPESLFLMVPLPLSQAVLLALVQQLGYDLENDIGRKLVWIREACTILNPNDPLLSIHMRPILAQVYPNLHQKLLNSSGAELNSLRVVLHVLNSLLSACK